MDLKKLLQKIVVTNYGATGIPCTVVESFHNLDNTDLKEI